jgi:adenylate cyclase class 2
MEIEVKARLEDAEAIKEKLVALGCEFSNSKTQDDMVWVENIGSLDTFLANKVFLRIRVQNGEKIILTAKKPKEKTGDGSLIKREHEVVVDSAEEARGILDTLGLKEMVRVIKTRRTTHYKDFEICIDEIESLGAFIELEKIASEEEAEKIQKEMIEFLATLGVPANNRVMKGYDILMLEKQIGTQ